MTDVIPRIAMLVPGDGVGDGMMRLRLLHAIRRRWPDHRVWWVTAGATALSGPLAPYAAPHLERIEIGVNVEAPPLAFLRAARRLPKLEIAFTTYSRMLSVWIAKRVLAPREFYACLALQFASSRRDPAWLARRPRHMLARLRSMAAAAGLDLPPARAVFTVGEAARRAAARIVPDGPAAIGFVVGSGNVAVPKDWPLDRFLAVAEAVAARGARPVFLIGPAERQHVAAIEAAVPTALIAPLDRRHAETGATGIELALALGGRLAAAVTNDAGLAHVLAVADAPLVTLFGPTDPQRWAPEVAPLEIVHARDFGSARIDAIPVAAVIAALDRLRR
jgi:ADP-heptose:LPS heptosyltransferase